MSNPLPLPTTVRYTEYPNACYLYLAWDCDLSINICHFDGPNGSGNICISAGTFGESNTDNLRAFIQLLRAQTIQWEEQSK